MNASSPAQPAALQSADGQLPPNWDVSRPSPSVERLVIGSWKEPQQGAGYESIQISPNWLTLDWKSTFPNLKAVHLWNLKGLNQLPAIPSNLHTLEVRNCPDLTALPELPGTLEVLDVSGCEGLAKLTPRSTTQVPNLKQVFFEDCPGLSHDQIVSFTTRLLEHEASALLELRVTNHANLADSFVAQLIDDDRQVSVAQTLIKVVLRGCKNLTTVGNLEPFAKLRHLDLSNCPNLSRIVDLPNDLQYLAVWGPEMIRFLEPAQEVPKFDLGTKEDPNVAGRFRTRKKFGGELTLGAHAKILFLGNGRAGKTTLANTLRRNFSRDGITFENLPAPDEVQTTDGVELGRWQTSVTVPSARREALRQMGRHHDWTERWVDQDQGQLKADLQIWDLGGQEIYHQTHRAFAGVGTVYVLVWRPKMTIEELKSDYDREKSKKEQQGEDWYCTWEEWRDHNRQHPLSYWVDYLTTLKDLKVKREGGREMFRDVLVVCPWSAADNNQLPNLRKELESSELLRKIDANLCFCFNSRDENCRNDDEYRRFVECLRERSGEVAAELSLIQPQAYEDAVTYVENELAAIHQERAAGDDVETSRCLPKWNAWCAQLETAVRPRGNLTLDTDDLEQMTAYLDQSGKVMCLTGALQIANRSKAVPEMAPQRHVVVDLTWILDKVYQLLSRRSRLFQKIQRNRGRVLAQDLVATDIVKSVDSDVGARPLFDFMEQCGILVPLGGTGDNQEFLATEKSLLPKWPVVAAECQAAVDAVCQEPGKVGWDLEFSAARSLCEFDIRPMVGRLGQLFGESAVFFQDGMQASGTGEFVGDDEFRGALRSRRPTPAAERDIENWKQTRWVLRFVWESRDEDSMLGTLLGGIVIQGPKAAEVQERLVALLKDCLGLGPIRAKPAQMSLALLPFSHHPTRAEEKKPSYDIFVSYSSIDNEQGWVADFVKNLKSSLSQHMGVRDPNRVWWDQERVDSLEELTPQIKDRVSRSQVLLVLLSPGYLNSKWCRMERETFFEAHSKALAQKRVQLVDLGLLGRTKRPAEFQDLRSEDFFTPKEAGADKGPLLGEPKPIEGHPPHVPFFTAVKNLAGILAKRLKSQP